MRIACTKLIKGVIMRPAMRAIAQFSFFLFVLIFNLNIASAGEHDETIIQPPLIDSNEEALMPVSCRTRDHLRWDVCFNVYEEDGFRLMKSFNFSNYGINRIVPMEGFGVGRHFEFMFEGLARSDMGLLIWDSPDEYESHGHLKMMTFFPREVLPAIRYESDSEKDIVIVTLPTKEEVVFNGKTKEIISGVILEGPIKQAANGSALNPDLTYNGSGVVIEANALADWPVGITAQEEATRSLSIKKKGHKVCKVPVRELWYTDPNKGGNTFFNKKYVTDLAFDTYLKKRCGFSIY